MNASRSCWELAGATVRDLPFFTLHSDVVNIAATCFGVWLTHLRLVTASAVLLSQALAHQEILAGSKLLRLANKEQDFSEALTVSRYQNQAWEWDALRSFCSVCSLLLTIYDFNSGRGEQLIYMGVVLITPEQVTLDRPTTSTFCSLSKIFIISLVYDTNNFF